VNPGRPDEAAAGPGDPRGPDANPAPAPEPLLELDNVHAAYGPFRALFGVSFSVGRRSVVALLGPNGAGKSTVARVATGLVPVTSGRIRFDGRDVTDLRTDRRTRLGISYAPEGRSVFATLTVEENLALPVRRERGRAATAAALEKAYQAFPQLASHRHQRAGTLSGGEQRMLSLASVLVEPPPLLVVDELSLGLAPLVIDAVFHTLAEIRDAGTSLLIVEQHVDRALSLADHVVLLNKGEVARQGPVEELRAHATSLPGL
jgi:branched-chain amino acid transport system ATP-binding protein